jgi:hypothetical protein
MTDTDEVRPHLTDARIAANQTYQRRRARTAVDVLLEVDPKLWDDATRRAIVRTLPQLAGIEAWEIGELTPAGRADPLGGWCDYVSDSAGPCTLTASHLGDHDPDPHAR